MIRINENLLTGGDIGNNPPSMGVAEIREQQNDPVVGPFYRLKGSFARTGGSGSFQPIEKGTTISFGILVKGNQPHTILTSLYNPNTGSILNEEIEITTDWQWIVSEGVALSEVQDGDIVRLFVYPKDFELHWAKAGAYIGAPSGIWTPPHTALTPEQIALMKYGEYKEIKSF